MLPRKLRRQIEYFEQTDLPEIGLIRATRPYKIPKGYMEWRWISGVLGIGAYMVREKIYPDLVGSRFAVISRIWYDNKSPVYCIDRDLFKELQQTEILGQKHLLKDLDPGITQFILVFPDNSIKTAEGNNLSFVIVDSVNLREYLDGYNLEALSPVARRWMEGIEKRFEAQVSWASMDDGGAVWYSGRGINAEGELVRSDEQISLDELSAGDISFIDRVENLIFNVLLLLTYEPETVTVYKESPKGFAKPNPNDKQKFWHPRWLQEPTEMKTRYIYTTQLPPRADALKRASPHPHVRKAHWKRVPCGKGRSDRKWVRIRRAEVVPNYTRAN